MELGMPVIIQEVNVGSGVQDQSGPWQDPFKQTSKQASEPKQSLKSWIISPVKEYK